MTTELKRFAFNQARFVFYAQYTIERDMIREDMNFEQAFERIRATPNGQKFLSNVSIREMKQEGKEPGSFMDANTDLGAWCNNEYGSYVEDFTELN
jgi:hypothetical protein